MRRRAIQQRDLFRDCSSEHHSAFGIDNFGERHAVLQRDRTHPDGKRNKCKRRRFRERAGCQLEWFTASNDSCEPNAADRSNHACGHGFPRNRCGSCGRYRIRQRARDEFKFSKVSIDGAGDRNESPFANRQLDFADERGSGGSDGTACSIDREWNWFVALLRRSMERRHPPYHDIHRQQRNRVTDPGAQSCDCWNGTSRGDHSRARRRNLCQRGIYGFYARFHERRWDLRERAVFAIDELGPALRRIGISFGRRRYRNPGNDAKYFCERYLPGRSLRLHAFQHTRIHRIGQQPC